MRSPGRLLAPISAILLVAGLLLGAPVAALGADTAQYVVVAEAGASAAEVKRAITEAGGTITARNTAIGTYTVTAPAEGFILDVSASEADRQERSRERPIGKLPVGSDEGGDPEVEKIHEGNPGGPHGGSTAGDGPVRRRSMGPSDGPIEPCARSTPATRSGSVGIIDSGVDASHPDLAAEFDTALSRNFVTDMPDIDGPASTDLHRPADHRRETATAPTSPGPSRRRERGRSVRRRPDASASSTSAAARTAATCSSIRSSTR